MARKSTAPSGRIRVGIGGWSYAPWRGVFYPKGLKQADELSYATSKLTSIEINATHYRLQSPKSFRIWGATAPDGFVFSVKGPRIVTQQKVLSETGSFITRFSSRGWPSSATGLDQSSGSSHPSSASTRTTSASSSICCRAS